MSTPPWRIPSWQKISGSLKRLLIWVLILATWEAAYRIIGWKEWVFPAPSHVVDSLLGMLNIHTGFGSPMGKGWPRPVAEVVTGPGGQIVLVRGAIWPAAGQTDSGFFHSRLVEANLVSLLRLTIGFCISVIIGATLGVMMWRFKTLDEFLGPLFLGMQTVPSVCWVPLAIVAFGLTEAAMQFVLVMGSFFAIAISLRDGLRTIPPLYQRAGLMLGARGWKLYRYVLLPASMPALASGLRQGFSFAWRSLLGAEFVLTAVKSHGLGYLLETGRDVGGVGDVIGIMIVMVVLGMLADRLAFAKLEQHIYRRFGLIAAR